MGNYSQWTPWVDDNGNHTVNLGGLGLASIHMNSGNKGRAERLAMQISCLPDIATAARQLIAKIKKKDTKGLYVKEVATLEMLLHEMNQKGLSHES